MHDRCKGLGSSIMELSGAIADLVKALDQEVDPVRKPAAEGEAGSGCSQAQLASI
jgi:hypothetical protein